VHLLAALLWSGFLFGLMVDKMLNDELKPRPNSMADDSMKPPCNKQKERKELELLTKHFLRNRKIHELPPSPEKAESLRF